MTEVKVGDKVLVPVKIIAKDSSSIPYNVNILNSNSRMWFDEEEMETAIKLPTLPKQIAEKLKEYKREERLLLSFLNFARARKRSISEEELALAWIMGYNLAEPPYEVRFSGTKNYYDRVQKLCYSEENGNYFVCGEASQYKHQFTKTELEQAGFGWVWDVDEIEKVEV